MTRRVCARTFAGLGLAIAASFVALPLRAGQTKPLPVSTTVEGDLAVNEWVKVEEHGAGRRWCPALVYLPTEKAFLLAMGSVGAWNDHGPFAYDELTFNLETRVWANRFPPGKEAWGPKVGIANPPPVPGAYYRIKDKEGNPRLGLWEGGFHAYCQYALDTDRNRLVVYTKKHTLEYDPVARTWRDLAPPTVPNAGSFDLWWGALSYDPSNKEFVLFGGNNGPSEFNDTRTWIYSVAKNEWRQLNFGSDRIKGLREKAKGLRAEAVALHAAYANRRFKSELPASAALGLADGAKQLAAGLEALRKDLAGQGTAYENTQCARATADLAAAAGLVAALGDAADTPALKTALALSRTLFRAEYSLMSEPPPRAYSPMVYDPATKKIVLFGGDRLDMLYADTWVYDCATRTWEERRPAISPSPRAGHAFLRLPKSGKLLLLGGYKFDSDTGYWGPLYRQLPVQAWTYDVAGDQWGLVKDWGAPDAKRAATLPSVTPPVFMGSKGAPFVAAVNDDDVVVAPSSENRTVVTRGCQLDAAQTDAAGTAKQGVKSGAVEWRVGPYDVDWYLDGPAPDEAAFQATLKALPANTWTVVTGKDARLPRQNRDWGTAVYDPDRQAIYRWSGGHSAHCGTDIPVFSMRTGRYHLKYPPAFPLEGIGSQASQPSVSDFLGHPWIAAHSYHSYAYDPPSKKMLCCGHASLTFAYDPESGAWTHKAQPAGMAKDNFYTLILCSTPAGAFAWTRFGALFRYDAKAEDWSEVKVGGDPLVATACDASGMCYDSKRDRLIMTHANFKGDLMAVDLKTMTAKRLAPTGMAAAAAAGHFLRETTYDDAHDLVVIEVEGKDKPMVVYDGAKNAWLALKVGGPNPTSRGTGLMYDAARKLVLAVDTNSVVYALRLDPAAQ